VIGSFFMGTSVAGLLGLVAGRSIMGSDAKIMIPSPLTYNPR